LLGVHRFYRDGVPGPFWLFAEGFAASIAGVVFGWWLFPDEVSLVCIFLAAIATDDSVDRVLAGNRRSIFEDGQSPWLANRDLIVLMFAMFLGTVVGFTAVVYSLPLETAQQLFSHQLAEYADARFQTLDFGHPTAILGANLYVLLFFFILAIPFRHGGVMLAVAWNASVWGATFGVLARRFADDTGVSLVSAYARVTLAVLPHMAVEALAFTIAGFAGVFLSKGLAKHAIHSDVLASISRTVVVMLVLAAGLIIVGAVFEGTVAGSLSQWLSQVGGK
jgi:uncharacterized membrane protein SpoIIM required for sporulation